MNPYLINYMNITAGQTVWFQAVSISAASVAMPLGGFLAKKVGFRVVVAMGSIVCSGGIALSALTVSKGLGLFLFTYSIMYGMGMGLPYSVLFSLASDVVCLFSL
ncbi:unnamed protein product [Hymenolepis diminuta]|uniref:Major facilitator superfamily (MFS) profile domain-containing protein n=1 Tax=Hymenolepis diminuta TaxID=6216 RepID=A0A564YBJ3_HYMDI|nr:unnamed protein product [Hymenolepis diminuta]VUZ43943.1 unnamed protein product [Hymenolepis diminuta]VUZ48290.1 unnamed protein product [Hymenolepis diminuta]